MFFFLAVLSMLAYSTQGALIAHHARKMDGISTVIYRSLSLVITLLPLLVYGLWREPTLTFSEIQKFSADFLAAGVTGAVASAFTFWSMRFIPVGVGNVFRRISGIVFAFLLGFIFFAEVPTWAQLGFVSFILLGAVLLSFQKRDFSHLDNNAAKGIGLSILSAVFAAMTFFFITKISRELNPFVSGYIWEFLIAIIALILGLMRGWCGGAKIMRISWRDFGRIMLVSSPTLVGTAAFLVAVNYGDFGIISAIGAGGIFVSILLSHFLYHEKLSRIQLLWISLIVIGIVGLKLVG